MVNPKYIKEQRIYKTVQLVAIIAVAICGIFLLKLEVVDETRVIPAESDIVYQSPKPKYVNINTATKEELTAVDGITSSIAERIIEYREQMPFVVPEDLFFVKGISDTNYDKIVKGIKLED